MTSDDRLKLLPPPELDLSDPDAESAWESTRAALEDGTLIDACDSLAHRGGLVTNSYETQLFRFVTAPEDSRPQMIFVVRELPDINRHGIGVALVGGAEVLDVEICEDETFCTVKVFRNGPWVNDVLHIAESKRAQEHRIALNKLQPLTEGCNR